MTTDTKPTIHEAIEHVRDAYWQLRRFEMDNARVLNQYEALQAELIMCRDELAWAIAMQGIDAIDDPAGELQLSYRRTDRGEYDVEKLPAHVRDNPAVTRLVTDRKAIDRAIKRGWLTRDEAAAAWQPNPSKPSVVVKPIAEES